MDMTISIHKDWIVISLYEKSINLYLCISPQYAHPLGVLTGLVSCNILRIHLFYSDKDDINRRMKEFMQG